MPSAVKLSDEIVDIARKEASVIKRSIAGQVEYWAELGRRVEAAGVVDYVSVRAVLAGQGSVQNLTPAETKLYLDMLGGTVEALDGSDTRRIRRLQKAGHPIGGEDVKGKLVVKRGRKRS